MGRVKQNRVPKDKKRCINCQYRGLAGDTLCCDFLLIMGHKRPCPSGDACLVYKMGDKLPCTDIQEFNDSLTDLEDVYEIERNE